MNQKQTRKEKARNRRYKKAAVSGLTFWEIQNRLEEIGVACDEVVYWFDNDDDETLIDALEGDSDDVERFKTDFAVLSSDAEKMWEDMSNINEPERYDDILVVCGIAEPKHEESYGFLMGYDEFEGDYFGIEPFEYGWAESESMKRLERLTKKQLMEQMAQTIKIAVSFIGLQSRYEDLKDSMDILRAQNKEYLDSVKEINATYDQIDWGRYRPEWSEPAKKIDNIARRLPQEAFL